jgi:hypothetical protein
MGIRKRKGLNVSFNLSAYSTRVQLAVLSSPKFPLSISTMTSCNDLSESTESCDIYRICAILHQGGLLEDNL